jgi:fumarate reductase flavoprotein subunit
MDTKMNRRTFLTGIAGTGALAALGAATACTPGGSDAGEVSDVDDPGAAVGGLGVAEETVECEILVVGAGAAGMFAAYAAGKEGARVTVISNSSDASTTNGSMVSGTSAVETKYVEEFGQTDVTTGDLFQIMYNFSHGMLNARLLKTCVDMQPGNIDIFDEIGIGMTVGLDRYDIGVVNVHIFDREAPNSKGQTLEDFITANFGAEFIYNTEAAEPILEAGALIGIKAVSDGKVIDYKAKAVVLACGGYIANAEKLMDSFGCEIVPLSTPTQTGKGIAIAEAAGAFRENIDGLGLSDIHAATKSLGFNLFNPITTPAFYGGLLVAPDGRRFMNEYDLAMASMSYGGEPLVHVQKYYAVLDEAGMRSHAQEGGYYAYAGSPECWVSGMILYSHPDPEFDPAFEEAVAAGWAHKFDTVAEAASALNMTGLEQQVTDYNTLCEAGTDTEFFKRPELLKALDTTGPIYLIQYNPGAFNTVGGCRTDEFCRALTQEFEPIPGLYISGVENGSLYGRPYFVVGGNMSGLAYSSGRLAGQQAASFIKGSTD